jgi:glycosyltransferase involved in cell wall biosynthesis
MASSQPSLLFVNQFYYPDVAATGQHLTDLAEFLAASHYNVTVFAASAAYSRRDGKLASKRDHRNGVRIRRFRSTSFGRAKHVGRIIDYSSFYLQVLIAILFGPRYDGVVFLTTPPLMPFIGLLARALRGQRYAVWSMDLHPAAEIAAGMLRSESLAARFLSWTWRAAHRRADFVIALGSFMKSRIVAEGIDPDRVEIIPPWSLRGGFEDMDASRSALRTKLQLEDRFVVMYSGNAGLVHDFEAICGAMRILKDDDRFFFLFVGDGPRRREIEAFANSEGVRNFAYRDYLHRSEIGNSLSVADVHLICLGAAFAGISVPSKLYGIMASARPTLFVGPIACESAETVQRAGCGVVVDPANGQPALRIVEALDKWFACPPDRVRQGENGRRAFLQDYEASTNCARMISLLESHWPSAAKAGG